MLDAKLIFLSTACVWRSEWTDTEQSCQTSNNVILNHTTKLRLKQDMLCKGYCFLASSTDWGQTCSNIRVTFWKLGYYHFGFILNSVFWVPFLYRTVSNFIRDFINILNNNFFIQWILVELHLRSSICLFLQISGKQVLQTDIWILYDP